MSVRLGMRKRSPTLKSLNCVGGATGKFRESKSGWVAGDVASGPPDLVPSDCGPVARARGTTTAAVAPAPSVDGSAAQRHRAPMKIKCVVKRLLAVDWKAACIPFSGVEVMTNASDRCMR